VYCHRDYYTQELLFCQANPMKKNSDKKVQESAEYEGTEVIYLSTDPLEYLTITV